MLTTIIKHVHAQSKCLYTRQRLHASEDTRRVSCGCAGAVCAWPSEDGRLVGGGGGGDRVAEASKMRSRLQRKPAMALAAEKRVRMR